MMMRRKKSPLWTYYILIDNASGGAKCKLCQRIIKYSGTTTNLRQHLTRHHKDVDINVENRKVSNKSKVVEHFETLSQLDTASDSSSLHSNISQLNQSSHCSRSTTPSISTCSVASSSSAKSQKTFTGQKQQGISESFSEMSSFSDGGLKGGKITNGIIYMIARDNLPLRTVEKEGFKYLMKITAPLYKIPSRRTISKLTYEKYEVLSGFVKENLKNVDSLTITTDCWTETMTTTSFMGITVHFLSELKLKSINIGVIQLSESHTAGYLAECLSDTLALWEITDSKIVTIVTDNGANIVKAISDRYGKSKHLPCFAHTLNLVPQKVLSEPQFKQIIDRVKEIVTYAKQNVNVSDELRKQQTASNQVELKLIQSVQTRWNSTYDMLARFIQLSEYIAPIFIKHPKAPPFPTGGEIEIIKDLLQILKPLEEATTDICGENYVTASRIIPLVHCLEHNFSQKIIPKTDEGRIFKNAIIEQINKRFGQIESVKLLSMTTLMDPRFRKIYFTNPLACSSAIADLNKALKDLNGSVEGVKRNVEVEENETSTTDLWAFHREVVSKSAEMVTEFGEGELHPEFKMYLNMSVTALTDNPIIFWESYKHKCKQFYVLARRFMSIVGTSVPSERLFSKAGNIITENRNRLKGKNLSKLLFLNSIEFSDWKLN